MTLSSSGNEDVAYGNASEKSHYQQEQQILPKGPQSQTKGEYQGLKTDTHGDFYSYPCQAYGSDMDSQAALQVGEPVNSDLPIKKRSRNLPIWMWFCVIVGFGVVYGVVISSAVAIFKVAPTANKRPQDGTGDLQTIHSAASTRITIPTAKPTQHHTTIPTRRSPSQTLNVPKRYMSATPGGPLKTTLRLVVPLVHSTTTSSASKATTVIRRPSTSTFKPTFSTEAPVNTLSWTTTAVRGESSTGSVKALSANDMNKLEKLISKLTRIMKKLVPESRCDVSTVVNYNLELPQKATTLAQDPSIDSLSKCQEACLDPAGAGVLGPGGTTCHGGIFHNETRKCWLTSYGGLYEHGLDNGMHGNSVKGGGVVQFVSFYNVVICYSTKAPGCNSRGIKWINRRPYPFIYKEGIPENATLADCIQGCNLLYRRQQAPWRCYGFTYDRHNMSCTFVTSQPGGHLEEKNGTDFYSYTIRNDCDFECHDTFPVVNYEQAASAKPSSIAITASVYKCRERCNTYHRVNSAMCYGFDYSAKYSICNVITEKDYSLQPKVNTTNYRRHIRCNDCPHGISYMSTMDTGLPYSPSLRRFYSPYLVDCERHCRNSPPGDELNATTCQAFTYDHTTKECVLTGDFWQDITTLGKTNGIDLYRRSYQCEHPSTCQETYTKFPNMSAKRGILQPADINSVSRCSDRCQGFTIAISLTCYGFDYVHISSRCYIHITNVRDRMINTTIVDCYVRDMKCE